MKRIRLITILGLLPLFLLTAPALSSPSATAKAKMLFFYQDGCHWCALMDKELHQPEMERLLLGHARVFRINVRSRCVLPALGENGIDLARKFKVYGTPTIIVVGAGEKVLLRIPGALSREDFQDVVSRYVPGVRRR